MFFFFFYSTNKESNIKVFNEVGKNKESQKINLSPLLKFSDKIPIIKELLNEFFTQKLAFGYYDFNDYFDKTGAAEFKNDVIKFNKMDNQFEKQFSLNNLLSGNNKQSFPDNIDEVFQRLEALESELKIKFENQVSENQVPDEYTNMALHLLSKWIVTSAASLLKDEQRRYLHNKRMNKTQTTLLILILVTFSQVRALMNRLRTRKLLLSLTLTIGPLKIQ